MRLLLAALALLLIGGCSAEGEPSEDPSTAPSGSAGAPAGESAKPTPPRPRLEAAQRALARAAGGAYTLRIDTDFTDAGIVERGLFDVQAGGFTLRRTIRFAPGSGEKGRLVLRVRSSSKHRFLQVEDWGPWDGCWGELTPDALAEIGLDIDLRGFPSIPVPVSLVLDARLSPESITPTSGPHAGNATVLTDGFTALQMLGVAGSVLFDLPLAVARVRVPAHITYFDEYPHVVQSVEVYGDEVREVFRDSKTKTSEELRDFVDARSVKATFAPADEPVRFGRPPARQLLPPGATADDTCAAHRHGQVVEG